MAKLTAISEEESAGPKPKKQRRDSISEEIDDQDEQEEELQHEDYEDEDEEIGEDEEEDYEEEAQVLVEDDKSDDTQKIDEECDCEDEDEDESREENEQRFFLTDLEFFDCSVCLRRLNVPIVYLCENEHVACNGCFSSSSVCTICAPSISYKRCRILERILKSIGELCENLKYGCKRPIHYTMKAEHERYCNFAPCSCPVEGCNFIAPSTELSVHLSNSHTDTITRFSFNQLYSISLGSDEKLCILQENNSGDVFVITNVKHEIGNMVSINQIGPGTYRSPFCLHLNAKDGKRLSLQLKCEIESIRSLVDDPLTKDFLLVPSRYFEGDEGFELLLRILLSGH